MSRPKNLIDCLYLIGGVLLFWWGVTLAVHAFRHPEKTSTQVIMSSWEAFILEEFWGIEDIEK